MVGNTVALLEGRVRTRCMVMLGGRKVDGTDGNTVAALVVGRVGTRCMVLLGGREVDGMDGNTVTALVVERAGWIWTRWLTLGGRWDGWKHGGAAGGKSRDTVHGDAGRERGGWV
jgi:hypothetical protein